jgi:hypothetical protein
MIDKFIYVIVAVFVIFVVLGFAIILSANYSIETDRLFHPDEYEQDDDERRIEDFKIIKTAIEKNAQEENQVNYCPDRESYCEGKSKEDDSYIADGSGWVKIDLRGILEVNSLPTGPFYNDEYFYRYCSDNKEWEINTKLTSKAYSFKAEQDGGTDPAIYEVGTNLNICK